MASVVETYHPHKCRVGLALDKPSKRLIDFQKELLVTTSVVNHTYLDPENLWLE